MKNERGQSQSDISHRTYEQSRYAALLKALQGSRYRRAFEPGCSVGVFTYELASFCDRVEAIDISPSAVARAKSRCESRSNVAIRCGSLPEDIPDSSFDLIVLSEIGYYFTDIKLFELIQNLRNRLSSPGTLLVSHWLGSSEDHVLSGDTVHEIARAALAVSPDLSQTHAAFRLDRWTFNV